jgi:hypothetical protein
MEPMIQLELTPDEANALASLIDLAVKAGGVRTAAAAMPIFAKLEQAATKPKETE